MPDGGRHTRIVRWLKVALPLSALALLSTLFLVSNRIGGDIDLPYSQVEIEDRLNEPRMTRPSYSGVTADGASLTLTAEEARPASGSQDQASALRVKGTLQGASGSTVTLQSDAVTIDTQARRADLTGAVQIATSEGFLIQTEGLTAALDISHLESTAPVTAEGPPGRITADHMELSDSDTDGKAHVLRFTGQVKLVYLPQSRTPDP